MGLAFASAAQACAASGAEASAGRMIAEQYCGGCHATGKGASPLADAPPFRRLYERSRPGHTIDDMLREGMLSPQRPRDEAPSVVHPRMPVVDLDSEQAAALRRYLLSFSPPRKSTRAGHAQHR
jgi:mono/diheme cytochrome c family protein